MARTVYVTTELQGGGNGLDGIDANNLAKGDMAFYLKKNTTGTAQGHSYLTGIYMASSRGSTVAMGSTEDQPNFIVPDSNGTNWIWGLTQPLSPVFYTTGLTAILPNYGVSIIRTETNTVHRLRRPRRGALKKIVFLTTAAVKIRLSSAAEAYTVKASSEAVVLVPPTTRLVWSKLQDGAAAIEMVGRTTARWDIISMFAATTSPKGKITFSSST